MGATRSVDVRMQGRGFSRFIGDDGLGLAPIFQHQTANISLGSATSTSVTVPVVPVESRLLALVVNVTTTIADADSTLSLGISGTTDKFVDGLVVPKNTAAGTTLVFKASDFQDEFVDTVIPAGTALLVTNDAAPSAGAGVATVVLAPN